MPPPMPHGTITFNNVLAKLSTSDREVYNTARKALTYPVPGAKFTPKFKSGIWDGTISLLDPRWTFPAGLVSTVLAAASKKHLHITLEDSRDSSQIIPKMNDDEIASCLESITLRDYQVAAIQNSIQKTRGIIQAPTGSGKTAIACGIIQLARRNGLKTLFITHTKELLYQTAKSITKTTGVTPGIIGDGQVITANQVSVGTVQTLSRRLAQKDPAALSITKGADLLIIDEAHRGDSQTFQATINACDNAYYRFGLTATPLMKGVIEDAKLIGVTGDIISKITIQDLVERQLLAQPLVKYVRISEPPLPKQLNWRQAYSQGVVHNPWRNNRIVAEVSNLVAAGCTVLVLVNEIVHGEILQSLLRQVTIPLDGTPRPLRAKFIHGSLETEKRQGALAEIQNGQLDVLVSSTITDEGVDIPSLSAAILAGGWKSPIKLYQRIGRAMRPKPGGNNSVYIVDFVDLTHKYLARHSLERFTLVRNEEGFQIVGDFELERAKITPPATESANPKTLETPPV